MAITSVQRPDAVRQEPKADPLDKILKGLQIASNIYGIRTSYEQSLLNQQKLASETERAKQEGLQSQLSQRSMNLINAGSVGQEEFNKNFYVVPDAETFKKKYGEDIPLIEVKIGAKDGQPEQTVLGVEKSVYNSMLGSMRTKEGKGITEIPDPNAYKAAFGANAPINVTTTIVDGKPVQKYYVDDKLLDKYVAITKANADRDYKEKLAGNKADVAFEKLTDAGKKKLEELDIGGGKYARSKSEATKLRENIANTEQLKSSIDKILEIKKSGPVIPFTERARAIETEQQFLMGALRLPLQGPGAMTDSDRKQLMQTVGDASGLFTINANTISKLSTIRNRLESNLNAAIKAHSYDAPSLLPKTKGQTKEAPLILQSTIGSEPAGSDEEFLKGYLKK